ncbi:recombinase family protein [Massilia sp. CMS3.1]|uniref:recombinase family protein n=1 Tax=Massilia sp. CMS3.1 TaxID=3373083 RepID=UPI003EE6F476
MNKVYSYIRFSDPRQAEGDSYRRQLADTLAYCQKNNLQLVSDSDYMFFDRGVSAYSGKLRDDNTELSRFLALVQAKEIPAGSTLIVESLDRLSREHVRQALPRFMDLLNAGITIHTLHGNKTYHADNYDQFDLFQSIMEMSRAHSESEIKSKRIKSRWQAKQEQAKAGVPLGKTKPAWLDLVYVNGSTEKPDEKAKAVGFRVNADRAAVVRQIFQYTRDGCGRNAIARMLNEAKIPAFRTKTGWGQSTIHQILNNESVLGFYQPYTTGDDGKRVPRGEAFMFYEPIIDRATFDAARAATAGRDATKARKQTPDFQIWQGIAKCAHCGSPLHTYGNGRKAKEEGQSAPRWMRCYNAKKAKCEAGSISVQSIEPVFAEILAKLNILALVQSSASAINAKLEVVTGQLVAERAKLEDFKADYAARRSNTIRDLMYETEDRIALLVAQEQQHLAGLAADQIVDKADFFARLDLHTFTGRSRANSILKRLQVEVRIDPAQRRFHVRKAGVPVFDLVHKRGEEFLAYPANSELSGIIQRQDGTWTPMLADDDNGEEPDYESEGHDSRDY